MDLLIHPSTDRLGTTPGNVVMSILIGVHTQLYLGNTYCRRCLLDHNICFSSILLRNASLFSKVGLLVYTVYVPSSNIRVLDASHLHQCLMLPGFNLIQSGGWTVVCSYSFSLHFSDYE